MMLFQKPHTLLTLLKIIKTFIIFLLIGCIFGCSLFEKPKNDENEALIRRAPSQRVFFASYEDTWRAIHQVVKYPIASENQDSGIIETEYVKMSDGFTHPEDSKEIPKGSRFKLIIKINQGKLNGRNSSRISIDKQIELLRDFFSEPQLIVSDGLEEKVLFYRIERELIVAEALKKVN